MIISRTPVRISFFGGGTDYREYFERNPGAVLGATIDKYIYVSVNRLSDFFNYNIRVGYSRSELVGKVEEIIHPSVRECLKFKGITGHLDIHIFADLPARTGLGSSSSFTVGLLNALYALEGKLVSKQKLAEDALYVEQRLIKENVGCQDQMHAAHGGLNIIEFDRSKISTRPVILSQRRYDCLNRSLMLFFTGITRHASEILKEQVRETAMGRKDAYLKKMFEMVHEAQKVISGSHRDDMPKKFGELVMEEWELKKRLSSYVTNDLIDDALEKAISAGAFGGKLLGAGGGGFLLFIAPAQKHESIRQALSGLLEVDFNMENEGSRIIYLLQ